MSTQTVVDVVISGSTTTVVDKRIDGVTTVAGAPPVTNVSGQVPDLGVNTDILATEGDILSLTNDVANLRANLIVTGTTLTDEVGVLSGHVISTGNNLEFQISTLSGNLIASGNNLDSLRDILSGNLAATGASLEASITGITGDTNTLTNNLISTGNNLQTQILNSGDILDDLSGNLITTGQTMTSNLISTGNLIQPQIDNIESNLITTGQTLLTTGSNLQALIIDNTNNLIDTGNNLEPRINTNTANISTLNTATGTLSVATGELQEYKFNKSGGVISGVILPHSSGALDLGSESLPFRTGFFNDIKVSSNTLFIGGVPVHSSNGGIDFSNATGVTVFEDVSIRNLTVTGTETIIDVEHLAVKDNIIIINSGETDAGIAVRSGGLVIDRGTLPDADLLFNENNDRFEFNFPLAINNNVVVTKNETGVYADVSNLQQTGVTLQTQITNNDADVTALNAATGELKTQSNTTDSNLITTGQFLTDEIAVVSGIAGGSIFDELSGDLITTGQTLTSEISIVSGLIGQEASDIDGLSGNLITTGQTLQTQITSNDSDISTLTSDLVITGSRIDSVSGNLITTGQNLQAQVSSNDSDIITLTSNLRQTGVNMMNLLIETGFAVMDTSGNADTISGNLISTGRYLTDEINTVSGMTTGGVAADIISGNLITTGQTLTSDIEIVSGLTVSNTNNLISTGNNLQNQITSNDGQIAGIIGDLVNTGQTLTTNINTVSSNLITTGKNLSNDIATVSGIAGGQDFNTLSGNLITTGQTLTSEIAIVSGLAGGEDFNTLSGNLITTGQYLTEEIAIVSGLTTGSSSDPALSGKVDTLSGNLITTGQTLTTNINTVSSSLIATGKTLTDNVNTVSSNLVSTGSRIDDISGNLITTGQTLQTQITSNDSDISTLTSNLGVTGQTLQTQITSNDSDISTLTSNLITTGQTLQTQITSNDSDISTLTSNLVTTGQTLTTDITTVSGLIVDNDGDITALKTATGVLKTSTDSNAANLITTGQTLQTQITSNDGDISTLTTNLGTTGQTLQTQITSNDSDISTLTSNLITTGQTLTTDISTVSGLITDNDADIAALRSATGVLKTSTDANTTNLITTGQTLQTQITSNDGDITTLTSNLVTTGQTLQTQITSNDSDISTLTTNVGTTGQTLQTQITSNDSDITSLTSNLITTGQTLTTDINTVSGLITDNDADITALKTATGVLKTSSDNNTANLITTGQTLQTQITSNDGDITTLTSNLATTGQTLQTQITSNDGDITTLTSNLVTTGQTLTTSINTVATNLGTSGQTLQTQITSNDSDISTLTSNLGTTGQTLQTQITSNDSDIASLTTNLGTTGQTLQTQITSNDSDISTLDSTTVKLTTNQSIAGNKIFTNDVTINNLTVTGTEVVVDVENLAVKDNIIEINSGESGAGISRISGGIVIDRGTATNANILYNDANDRFELNFPLAVEGEVVASASNLITTGQTLTTNINTVSTNLGTSGQTLQTQITSNDSDISTLTTNLGTTGQTLQTQITSNDSDISTLTTNLGTTGQTLQTQITSNDSDISTLTSNLVTTGQTLQTQITSNDSDISTLTTNLGTTGQTLQTQITSNDSDISTLTSNLVSTGSVVDDISGNLITTGQTLQTQITSNDSDITTLTSNLVTTGQTLTTNINTVSTNLISTGKVVDDISGNLITTGQTLQTQITSNDTDITNLSSNLVTTGQTLTTNINTVATNLVTTGQTLTSEIATVSGLIPATVIDGGGTANTVPLWSDANTIGDSVISQSSSKIGIGIASPSFLLHLQNASSPTIRVDNTVNNSRLDLRAEDSAVLIRSTSNFPMRFDVNQTERMRIDTAGNVGIGTNAPTARLNVKASGSTVDQIAVTHSGNTVEIAQLGQSANGNSGGALLLKNNGGTDKIYLDAAGASYLSGGAVGVGTVSPNAGSWSNAVTIQGASSVGLELMKGSSLYAFMGVQGSGSGHALDIAAYQNQSIRLRVGSNAGTTAVTILNDGKVGIGVAAPSHLLQVNGTVSFRPNGSSNNQHYFTTGGANNAKYMQYNSAGTLTNQFATDNVSYITGGSVGIGTVTPSSELHIASSDNRPTLRLQGNKTSDGNFADIYATNDGSNGEAQISFRRVGANDAVDMLFYTSATGSAMAERMRIASTGAITFNTAFTFPTADGSAGQVLQTNGSGTVTWATVSGGGGVSGSGTDHYIPRWNGTTALQDSSIIALDSGSVGIGTATPAVSLHITKSSVGDNEVPEVIRLSTLNSASPSWSTTDGLCIGAEMKKANGTTITKQPIKFRYDGGDMATTLEEGNVGIGTASPAVRFHVYSGTSDTAARFQSSDSTARIQISDNDTDNYIVSNNSTLSLGANNTTHAGNLNIASDGSVGIGTNAPGVRFHLVGAAGTVNSLATSVTAATMRIQHNSASSLSIFSGNTASSETYFQAANYNGTTAYVIALNPYGGNVGIGTNSPSAKLESYITSGGEKGLRLNSSFGGGNAVDFIPAVIGVSNAGFSIDLAGTNRFVINDGGNVGVGTNNAGAKLHVNGDAIFEDNGSNINIKNTWSSGNHDINFIGGSSAGGSANNTAARIRCLATAPGGAATGSLTFTVNSGDTFVDALYIKEDGKVGIGTNTPVTLLDVYHATHSQITISSAGNQDSSLSLIEQSTSAPFGSASVYGFQWKYDGGDNKLYLSSGVDTNVVNRLTVQRDDGNVGIGTVSPAAKLDIRSSDSVVAYIIRPSASPTVHIGSATSAGAQIGYVHASDYAFFGHDAAFNAIVVNSSGSVGIGNAAPAFKLQVNGTVRINSGDAFLDDGQSIRWGGTAAKIDGSSGGDYLRFYTDGAERMRIISGGSVGIGTDAPATKLHVEGDFKVGTTNNGNWMGYKDVTLNGTTYTTALTINLNNHTGCYVKLFLSGDWSSHSAVAFVGEYFVQNGSDAYAEPGTVISEFDNTNTDSIESKIVDPSSDTFTIQLKLSTAANGTLGGKLSYHVMGMATAVS